MSLRKCLAFLCGSWAASTLISVPYVGLSITNFANVSSSVTNGSGSVAAAVCSADPASAGAAASVVYHGVAFAVPIVAVLVVNLKIVGIAKYHQFRYVSSCIATIQKVNSGENRNFFNKRK